MGVIILGLIGIIIYFWRLRSLPIGTKQPYETFVSQPSFGKIHLLCHLLFVRSNFLKVQ